ncbi:MAG: glutamyl-tRNA synthetase [Acidobacteria bacterium]|nr:glutamyl-tRNA synthetase [Acidobacteriota bacterium]
MSDTVRTRIAPSPTGDPHVGTAYVALFNYAWARKHGGAFLLRIEDTDRERERSAVYREHAEQLIASGHAYPCFCSRERLDALREEQRRRKVAHALGYDGHCRDLAPAEAARRRSAGEPCVIRLAMPREGESTVADLLRGEIRIDHALVDDQVLLKSDGFPTYHLANVVDDHLMGITHVIRAEEWISSLPKHAELYRAFGWREPVFCHLPLLRNADRSKISKRKNPVSLNYYRRAGFLPEAILNYLALMGWAISPDRDEFSLPEFVAALELSDITLGGPVFDLEKLRWMNGKYVRKLPVPELLGRLRSNDAEAREKLVGKKRSAAETATTLAALVEDALDPLLEWDAGRVEAALRAFADKSGWKPGDLFMPVRVAVTGRTATPPLFETMDVLGREVCRRRLRRAVEVLREVAGVAAVESATAEEVSDDGGE